MKSSLKQVFTTGEVDFAECRTLCRVPKIGILAKISTRQRVALPSATECLTLGKKRHSAKDLFAECNTHKKMSLDGWILSHHKNSKKKKKFFDSTRQSTPLCLVPLGKIISMDSCGKTITTETIYFRGCWLKQIVSENLFIRSVLLKLNHH